MFSGFEVDILCCERYVRWGYGVDFELVDEVCGVVSFDKSLDVIVVDVVGFWVGVVVDMVVLGYVSV